MSISAELEHVSKSFGPIKALEDVTLKIQKGTLKKEAFNLDEIKDPLYVLLPNSSGYKLLTEEIYDGILNSKYNF